MSKIDIYKTQLFVGDWGLMHACVCVCVCMLLRFHFKMSITETIPN